MEERRRVGQKPRGKKREEGNKKKTILGQRPLGYVSTLRMGAVTLKKKLHRKASLGPEAIMDVRPPRMEAVTLKKNLDRKASRGPEAVGPEAIWA